MICAWIAVRISATGRSRIAAIRSVAPEATRPPKPRVLESVVDLASAGPTPRPRGTMLHPSVVELASAICSARSRAAARTRRAGARAPRAPARSRPARPPSSSSRRSTACIASTVARGAGRTCRCSGRRTAPAPAGPGETATRSMRSPRPGRGRRARRPGRAALLGPGLGPRSSPTPRTRIWSIPSIGPRSPQRMTADVEVAAEDAALGTREEGDRALDLIGDPPRVGDVRRMQLASIERRPSTSTSSEWHTRRWPPRRSQSARRGGFRTARRWRPSSKCGLTSSAFACPVRLERKRTGSAAARWRASGPRRRHGSSPTTRSSLQSSSRLTAQSGTSWSATTSVHRL